MNTVYRAILVVAFLGAMMACKRTIDIPFEEAKRVPTANFFAVIDPSEESKSEVFLSRTHLGRPDPIKDAEVSISVNGTSYSLSPSDERYIPGYTRYALYARSGMRYRAGDIVELRVRTPRGELLTASQRVPEQVALSTASIGEMDSVYSTEYSRMIHFVPLRVTLSDNAAQANYYRLLVMTRPVYILDSGDKHYGNYSIAKVDYYRDYILTDGHPRPNGDLIEDMLPGVGVESNASLVFSDALFSGQQATLEVRIGEQSLAHPTHDTNDASGTKYYRADHTEVQVRLVALTEDTFRYYRTLDVLNSSGYDPEHPFVTPVQVYANVAGGTGIFAISTIGEEILLSAPVIPYSVYYGYI